MTAEHRMLQEEEKASPGNYSQRQYDRSTGPADICVDAVSKVDLW